MTRTTQIALFVAVAAMLLIGLAIPVSADRDDDWRYRAPQRHVPLDHQCGHQWWTPNGYVCPHGQWRHLPGQVNSYGQWLPPGQAMQRGQWIPPGQRKKMDRYDDHRYSGPCDYRDGRYYDRRYDDRRYDRRGDDEWGVVIRSDRRGTTVGGYYHDRNW